MTSQNHTYHLVEKSAWPLITSGSVFIIALGIVQWFHYSMMNLFIIGMISMLIMMYLWWKDMIRESTFLGFHTMEVTKGIQMGVLLFIASEVMFFFSFFWTFFYSSLDPVIHLSMKWPPKGIIAFDPFNIPLMNSYILMCSSVSVTWAHHSLVMNNQSNFKVSMVITIILGVYFTMIQYMEYMEASFCISDAVYGSIFFVATGFHGLHVIIGTIFLTICLIRQWKFHMNKSHHQGFEAAAWYWHFVDTVWLFLYMSIYLWTV
uniref:Cytochrome c oxidase subunit 3 n=1 Tax=Argulus americanus TaxID=260819 RepID=Q6SL20_9CRUS|nr:cytochrome c oxidase subunit III [Argulus americanus]AAS00853.1 cytochrome c oxidase subunit 3 [Argulus americanus]